MWEITASKSNRKRHFSRAEWAPCSRHNEGRRADGSLCHNMDAHPSHRSLCCSAPYDTQRTESVPGATSHPVLWSPTKIIILMKRSGRNIKSISLKCFYGNNSTFPKMHFLHEAQVPFAVVCTPIFSRSELRPPSRSSIISVFLLTVGASGADVLPLVLLYSVVPPSVCLSTDCCCVDDCKSCEK